MKKLIAYLFFGSLALQITSPALLLADYHLNLSRYLAQCINKTKPASNCKGKCQLNNKIAENEKQQQQPGIRLIQKVDVLSTRSFPPVYNAITVFTVFQFKESEADCIKDISLEIFHPPRVS